MTVRAEFNSDSFYKFLAERKLMASQCKNCCALYLPPHPICTKCHGYDMEWVQLGGEGKLAAFTVVAVGPTFTIKEGYDRNKPYVVGIVELKEGAKISGRIIGFDANKPNDIKVGTPLIIEFQKPTEGMGCYILFRVRD